MVCGMLLSWPAIAQTASPSNHETCDQHKVGPWCDALVFEFYRQHGLIAGAPVPSLDDLLGDTKALGRKLAPKAILTALEDNFKNKAERAAQQALQTISTSAAVNQAGGSSNGSGSTDLTTKPTTTDFISVAEETGAFTSSQNGSALTIQANALGVAKYLGDQPMFRRVDGKAADVLQPLTFAVGLNVTQSGTATTSTSGSANSTTPTIASIVLPTNDVSFSSLKLNFALYRAYNPQDKKFAATWKKAVTTNQAALTAAGSSIANAVDSFSDSTKATIEENLGTPLSEWHAKGAAAEKGGNFDAFVNAFADYNNEFCDYLLARPDAPKAVLDLQQAIDAFSNATNRVLNQARGKPLLTVTYLYSTPAQKPATHSATVVFADVFRGGRPVRDASGRETAESDDTRTFLSGAQLTANFSTEIYSTVPSGAKYAHLRDLQMSAEFDKPIGGTTAEPFGTFSVAGYGQYQYDPTVLNIGQGNVAPGTDITLPSNAQVLLGTAGWTGVMQGKFALNLTKGLNIPIAVKWSNKTDLMPADKQHSDVRGQFGLSYDLSALQKLIRGGS